MDLLETRDGRGVTTLTLNRPHRRNALEPDLIVSFTRALERLDVDADTRVVILSGAGEDFCAGGDIEWMRRAAQAGSQANEADALALARMFALLDRLSKPTVALVQGAAFGGGVGLVAACDVAIAARSAKFCMSEVRLGLIPAIVGPYVMRAVGARQARALFLTAAIVRAERAQEIGLVHEAAPDGGLSAARDRVVEALLLGAPGAQAQSKRLVEHCLGRDFDAALMRRTACLLAERRASAEGLEGLSGFLEKRAPTWRTPMKA